VCRHGWDSTKTLSHAVRATQHSHPHSDARMGLLAIDNLVSSGVAQLIVTRATM